MDRGWNQRGFQDQSCERSQEKLGKERNPQGGGSIMVGKGDEKTIRCKVDVGMDGRVEGSVVCPVGTKSGYQKVPCSNQFARSEQRSECVEDQVRSSPSSTTVCPRRRLDVHFRYKGGLSSYQDPSRRLESAWNRMEGEEVRTYSSPFRFGVRSLDLHKSGESNGKIPQRERIEDLFLHRRFHRIESIKGESVEGQNLDRGGVGDVRMAESGGQGLLGTNKEGGIFGFGDKHRERDSGSRPREDEENIPKSKLSVGIDEGQEVGKEESSGNAGRFFTKHLPSLSSSKVRCQSYLRQYRYGENRYASKMVEAGRLGVFSSRRKLEMVPKECKRVEREEFPSERINSSNSFGYGLFSTRIRSFNRRSNNEREVERRDDLETHRSEGVEGSTPCSYGDGRRPERKESSNSNGQYDSPVLLVKSWREESGVEPDCKRNLEVDFELEDTSPKTVLDKFKGQRFYGWPQQRFGLHKLEPVKRSFLSNFEGVRGYSSSGSLRKQRKHQMQEVQLGNEGARWWCSGSHRLFLSSLGRSSKLRSLPFPVNRESVKACGGVQGHNDHGSSKVEVSTLVHSVNEPVKGGFGFTFTADLLWGKREKGGTDEKRELDFYGSDDHFLDRVCDIIGGAWAASTKEKYLKSWKKLEHWLSSHGHQVYPVSVIDLCKYLVWLKESAPSEVRIIVEVIKWLDKFNNISGVVNNEFVVKLVDAIDRQRKKKKKVEAFPVKILKYHLEHVVVGEGRLGWLKVALIVGLCLRFTWRTETIRMLRPCDVEFVVIDNLIFVKIKIYKSKTNQSGEEKVYWLDPSNVPAFCLVSLLKEYLISVFGVDWRNSQKFLFFNDKGNQITTSSVSYLINKMAKKANVDIKFSSKSLRIGAVDWMVTKGMTFESIRALGWAENSPALSAYIRVSQLAVSGGVDKMFSN